MGQVGCIGRIPGAAAADILPMVVEVPSQAISLTPISEAKETVVNGEHWIVYEAKPNLEIDHVRVWQRQSVTTNGYH